MLFCWFGMLVIKSYPNEIPMGGHHASCYSNDPSFSTKVPQTCLSNLMKAFHFFTKIKTVLPFLHSAVLTKHIK